MVWLGAPILPNTVCLFIIVSRLRVDFDPGPFTVALQMRFFRLQLHKLLITSLRLGQMSDQGFRDDLKVTS